MTGKKKLLYSELAASAPAPAAPDAVPGAVPNAVPNAVPVVRAAPTPRKSVPVDLARALAAARAVEAQHAAATGSAPGVVAPPGVGLAAASAPSGPRSLRERVRGRNGQVEILLFRVGAERFGIELAAVEEAIDIPPVHHVPEMPAAMLGVITVRGMLTSVYSPAGALGLALHDGTSALIFRRGRSRLAVVVDEVDDVNTLDLSLLRDAPMLEASDGIVLGVVRQRDALLALVDTDSLLAACQAVPLLETA